MMEAPQFPPLLSGEVVPTPMDPFDQAIGRAIAGIDSGTIFYSEAVDSLRAALVLAPETPLDEAVQAVYVAQIEDQKLEHALHNSEYLESTAQVLQRHNGLWFNDESFIISRKSG